MSANALSLLEKIISAIKNNDFKKQQIDLSDEDIGDGGVAELVKILNEYSRNVSVKEINLSGNSIGDRAAEILITVKGLKKLNVNDNQIGPQGARSLSKAALEELDIGSNPIQDEGITHLAGNSTLLTLEAAGCKISSKGAAKFFTTNKTVEELDFSENNVGDEGVKTLSENSVLRSLSLTHAHITHQGAGFISKNIALRSLDLNGNYSVGDEGTQALAKAQLEEINLTNNGVGDQGIAAFADNRHLKRLIMFANRITSAGINTLLAKNKSLSFINVCQNKIDDECIMSLMTSTSLTEVDATWNGFTNKSAEYIKRFLEKSSIRSINISNHVVKRGLFIKPTLTQSERNSKDNSPKGVGVLKDLEQDELAAKPKYSDATITYDGFCSLYSTLKNIRGELPKDQDIDKNQKTDTLSECSMIMLENSSHPFDIKSSEVVPNNRIVSRQFLSCCG